MRLPRRGLLIRDRRFVVLWSGQAISEVGNAVTTLVLPLLAITMLGASTAQIGVMNACATVAVVAVSIPGGVLVDRSAKLPLMIGCDVLRGLILGTVPLLAALHQLRMGELYAVSAMTGALALVFGVAYHAYYPALVGPELLGEANSKIASTEAFARVSGPGLGAWVAAAVGVASAVLADAASYLVSVVSLILIRSQGPGRTGDGPLTVRERTPVLREAAEGFRLVAADRVLAVTAATVVISVGCLSMTNAVFMYFLVHDVRLSSLLIGFVFAVGEGGGLVAALLSGPILRRVGTARIMCLVVLAGPAGLLVVVADHSDAVVLTCLFMILSSTRFVSFDVAQYSYRQTVSPAGSLGKVTATVRLSLAASSTLGALGGGWLGVSIGPRATLVVATVLVTLSGLPVLVSPLRSARDIAELPAIREALRHKAAADSAPEPAGQTPVPSPAPGRSSSAIDADPLR